MEFWRSAERIGARDAYVAYIATYPNGVFVALARAAADRSAGSPASSTAKQTDESSESAVHHASSLQSTLTQYSAPADSGAVSFRVGDKFYGPGAITVGWFGAKKQLVLPNGEWAALAAVDHNSTHAASMQLTSIAFGQFDSAPMQSLSVAVFTRRPGAAGNTWSDASVCESSAPGKL